MPSFLTALSLAVIAVPDDKEVPVKGNMYTLETEHYNSKLGVAKEEEPVYELSGSDHFWSRHPVDASLACDYQIDDHDFSIDLTMSNDDRVVRAKIAKDFQGDLFVESITLGKDRIIYDERNLDYVSATGNMPELFDRLMALVLKSNLIDESEMEKIKALTDDEKTTYMLDVFRYVYLGEEDVLINRSRAVSKYVLWFATILYDAVLMISYKGVKKREFKIENGELMLLDKTDESTLELEDEDIEDLEDEDLEDEDLEDEVLETNRYIKEVSKGNKKKEKARLLLDGLEMREMYLAAERERIKAMYLSSVDCIKMDNCLDVFTNHERKILGLGKKLER